MDEFTQGGGCVRRNQLQVLGNVSRHTLATMRRAMTDVRNYVQWNVHYTVHSESF